MYFENMDHAVFNNITVNNSGTSGAWAAGIDFNLKYHAFQNITISNSFITNCGTGNVVNGVGIAVKARDDGGYAGNPATLANASIHGCTFSGCQESIRFGEPTKNNAGPTNVHVDDCTIAGSILKGIRNESLSLTNASPNWWGHASGPYHPVNNPGGLGDDVSNNVLFDPWYLDAGMTTLSESDIDIGIFATTCGDFAVKLKVYKNYSSLTNVQFTLKWPDRTKPYRFRVQLSNYHGSSHYSCRWLQI